jgi:hypothetical protein
MARRAGIECSDQDEDQETFDQAKDEGEKELGSETFQKEPPSEKLSHIEDEGSGEGIETKAIPRKKVHEKTHQEG